MIHHRFSISMASILLLCAWPSSQGFVVDLPMKAHYSRSSNLPFSNRRLSLPARRHASLISLQVSAASSQDEQEDTQQSSRDDDGSIIRNDGGDDNNQYDDSVRRGLKRLAQLSLEDYAWRAAIFKEKEADRRMEESLARMMGEDPLYVRPMDASENKIGPLGRAEKAMVGWLSQVIDEEGRRAKKIVNADGELIRPIDAGDGKGELGPLGTLEMRFVEFLNSIRAAEKLRVKEGVWRPKDLDESTRGPLGQLELSVTSALRQIQESEMLRMEQSQRRGGDVVRPIDVPGPLGEFELAVAEVIQTERLRAKDGEKVEGIIRPKDATVKGMLGECEDQAVEALSRLTEEERERLRSIQQKLQDSRPMAAEELSVLGVLESIVVGILRLFSLLIGVFQRKTGEERERLQSVQRSLHDIQPTVAQENSLLGVLESILVGILRAPALMIGVFERVKELLASQNLDEKDQALLDRRRLGEDKMKD